MDAQAMQWSSRRQFWILQGFGWCAFVVALILPWIGALPIRGMLIAKAPLVIAGVAATLLLRALYRALMRRGTPVWVLAVAVCAASYLASLAWSISADWASRFVLHQSEHASLIRLSFDRFGGTLYCMLVLTAWSLLYLGITHHRALVAEREHSLRAESDAREARLEALRYQVNPHFLFNSLNAVSTLIVERRNEEATTMIAQLGGFLHHTLRAEESEIALAEELRFARQYLEIERVRFGDRLTVTIEAADDIGHVRVPAFILLPILENAIRHAVECNERGGRVSIDARRHDGAIRIAITDDGPGLHAVSRAGAGIGLANTRARLAQLYGDHDALCWRRRENGGSEFVLELPIGVAPVRQRELATA